MFKVSAKWVLRNLTAQDWAWWVSTSRELVDLFHVWRLTKTSLYIMLVTWDITWICHWDPEGKQESMQWRHALSPPPRKFTLSSLARLWQPSFGIANICCYLILQWMYSIMPICCWSCVKKKRRGMPIQGVWLLRDSSPVHKSLTAQQAVRDSGFVQLYHPAYSPELSPSDCYLFWNLKSHLHDVY